MILSTNPDYLQRYPNAFTEIDQLWSNALHNRLRLIDPSDLEFHRTRYTSGEHLQSLIILCRESTVVDSAIMRDSIESIALDCEDDGSTYGAIPCLGGYAVSVWVSCLEYIDTYNRIVGTE